MTTVAVIGAGVTGLTTAYELLDRGFEVTVFDRHRYAAMETSFANGGQLSASNAETWTQWGTVLKGLKWMLSADAPLLVNPRPTLHKIGWMAEFLSNIPRYKANTVETVRLAIAARAVLFEMAAREGIGLDSSSVLRLTGAGLSEEEGQCPDTAATALTSSVRSLPSTTAGRRFTRSADAMTCLAT